MPNAARSVGPQRGLRRDRLGLVARWAAYISWNDQVSPLLAAAIDGGGDEGPHDSRTDPLLTVATTVYPGRAQQCPLVPARPKMYPSSYPRDAGAASGQTTESPICRAFSKPSDGLEPSTPPLPCHFHGNRSQSAATVFASLSRSCGRPMFHRLPPVATARLHKRSIFSGKPEAWVDLADGVVHPGDEAAVPPCSREYPRGSETV